TRPLSRRLGTRVRRREAGTAEPSPRRERWRFRGRRFLEVPSPDHVHRSIISRHERRLVRIPDGIGGIVRAGFGRGRDQHLAPPPRPLPTRGARTPPPRSHSRSSFPGSYPAAGSPGRATVTGDRTGPPSTV